LPGGSIFKGVGPLTANSCRTKLCAYNLLRNLPNMVVFQS
jgi:hypothetical protein